MWTSPDLGSIRDAVIEGLRDMPWQQQIPADALEEVQDIVEQNVDIVFQIIELIQPSIPSAISGLLLQPLGLVFSWLIVGLLAFIFAKLLGGTGTLSQTYGTTALAAAPHLLGVVNILPYVQTAGLTMWSLICTYLAIKYVHDLTPGRAFWAIALPIILLIFLLMLAGVGIGVAIGLGMAALGGAG
jgi:hypothetical protein